jgi:predicted transport protein
MVDHAVQTMIDNLPGSTGRSLQEWFAVLAPTGLDRHGQVLAHLKGEHGVSHGYANFIALRFLASGAPEASDDDLVDQQYRGPKADLRPVYERIVTVARSLGDDVEVAPKKANVSLRRHKQFALVEPATRERIDLGLNLPGEPPTERLRATTGMCTHKVAVTSAADVDDELISLLRRAYERA